MKLSISTIALIAGLSLTGSALAQTPSVGGPDAKGNAPLKDVHTINDGSARKGANSFTQNEARNHIMNSGYVDVSGLAKGKDGIWRGTATKDGVSRSVALDYKGNVSDGGPSTVSSPAAVVKPGPVAVAAPSSSAAGSTMGQGSAPVAGSVSSTGHHRMHQRHHHHRRHHGKVSCANPGPNGAACSGQDRNHNGISDKEDRAIKAGAKP